jgi:hypothetical protein
LTLAESLPHFKSPPAAAPPRKAFFSVATNPSTNSRELEFNPQHHLSPPEFFSSKHEENRDIEMNGFGLEVLTEDLIPEIAYSGEKGTPPALFLCPPIMAFQLWCLQIYRGVTMVQIAARDTTSRTASFFQGSSFAEECTRLTF